jgi:O-antigen/teichoic acid export membrane protein
LSDTTMKGLRSGVIWSLVGTVINAFAHWAILSILAKYGSVTRVGEYTFALSVITPLMLFSSLQLRSIIASDVKHEYHFGSYLSVRMVSMAAAVLVIVFISLSQQYPPYIWLIMCMLLILKCGESISDNIYGQLQRNGRMDWVGKLLSLRSIAMIIVFLLSMILTRNVPISLGSMVLVVVGFIAMMELRIGRAFCDTGMVPSWNKESFFRITKLGFPLGAVIFLNSLSMNIPRYVMEHFRGLEDLGYFGAIFSIGTAGSLVVSSIGQAAIPSLAIFATDKAWRSYFRLTGKLICAALLLGIAGIAVAVLWGDWLLSFLFTSEYSKFQAEFVLYMGACAISYVSSVLGISMTSARFIVSQVPLNVIMALFITIAGILLIPHYGIWGGFMAITLFHAFQVPIKASIIIYGSKNRPRKEAKQHRE